MKFIKLSHPLNLQNTTHYIVNNSFKEKFYNLNTTLSESEFRSDIQNNIDLQYIFLIHLQSDLSPTTQHNVKKDVLDQHYIIHLYSVYKKVIILENNNHYCIQCSSINPIFLKLKNVLETINLDFYLDILYASSIKHCLNHKSVDIYEMFANTDNTLSINFHSSNFISFLKENLILSGGTYSFIIPIQNFESESFREFINAIYTLSKKVYCLTMHNNIFSIIIHS